MRWLGRAFLVVSLACSIGASQAPAAIAALPGAAMAWGTDTFGQLGVGTTTEADLPDAIPGLTNV
jgi:hypothetical protein